MKCNCDTEDGSWHADEGFLSDKNTLPVTKLRFGDTKDDDSEGRYTLGPLECRGIGKSFNYDFYGMRHGKWCSKIFQEI